MTTNEKPPAEVPVKDPGADAAKYYTHIECGCLETLLTVRKPAVTDEKEDL